MAAEVAETVTKESWESLVKARVTDPLHLSSIAPYSEPNRSPVRNYAYKTETGPNNPIETNGRPTNPVHLFSPSAALRGTTKDLLTYGITFLEKRSLQAFFHKPEIAESMCQPESGFGWTIGSMNTLGARFTGTVDRIPDPGLIVGGQNDTGSYRTNCRIGIYRRTGTVIVVLANSLGPQTDGLFMKLIDDIYRSIN